MYDFAEPEFTGRWDEFFSRLNPPGTTQTLAATELSARLPQPGAAVVHTRAGDGAVTEQGRETSGNGSLPVPASS
jgi:hypothetical protein